MTCKTETKQSIAFKEAQSAKSSVENTITATAGGVQATAILLDATKSVHNVTTVATAADAVRLPLATGSGVQHLVNNSGSASMKVYGSGIDTIDAVATATGVNIGAGKVRLFVDITTGKWISLLGA
jgi:hypothetical protein